MHGAGVRRRMEGGYTDEDGTLGRWYVGRVCPRIRVAVVER
jgi:hypothetical protein